MFNFLHIFYIHELDIMISINTWEKYIFENMFWNITY